jgi:hypothetical protein
MAGVGIFFQQESDGNVYIKTIVSGEKSPLPFVSFRRLIILLPSDAGQRLHRLTSLLKVHKTKGPRQCWVHMIYSVLNHPLKHHDPSQEALLSETARFIHSGDCIISELGPQ